MWTGLEPRGGWKRFKSGRLDGRRLRSASRSRPSGAPLPWRSRARGRIAAVCSGCRRETLTAQLSDSSHLSLESKAKIAHKLRGSALAVGARRVAGRGAENRGIGLSGRRPAPTGHRRPRRRSARAPSAPVRSDRGRRRNRPHSGLDGIDRRHTTAGISLPGAAGDAHPPQNDRAESPFGAAPLARRRACSMKARDRPEANSRARRRECRFPEENSVQ